MLVHLAPRFRVAQAAARAADPEAAQALFRDDTCCVDEGVRTHGSVAYASILRGYSHGCHRLFNDVALRLVGFLLKHRAHVRHGELEVSYDRTLRTGDESFRVRVRSRGHRFELTPAVPIEVLEGRLRGPVRKPIPGLRPLREQLIPAARAAAAGSPDAPNAP
jgi:hypothetical protein